MLSGRLGWPEGGFEADANKATAATTDKKLAVRPGDHQVNWVPRRHRIIESIDRKAGASSGVPSPSSCALLPPYTLTIYCLSILSLSLLSV